MEKIKKRTLEARVKKRRERSSIAREQKRSEKDGKIGRGKDRC